MPGEGQRVAGKGDFRTAWAEDDLDDIDADGDGGMAKEAEPGLRAADEGILFVGIDGIRGTAKGAGRTGLDLDENEGVFFPADEVDLAAVRRTEVAVEDFEAEPA